MPFELRRPLDDLSRTPAKIPEYRGERDPG
jgi:hypothetical protein